jgi:hypothetical protein
VGQRGANRHTIVSTYLGIEQMKYVPEAEAKLLGLVFLCMGAALVLGFVLGMLFQGHFYC